MRRATIGIISIVLDGNYRLSLKKLIGQALALLGPKLNRPAAQVAVEVLEFFRGRFVNLLGGEFASDAVEAAVSADFDDLVDVRARIAALSEFKARPDFEALAVAFKRIGNIIKDGTDALVDPSLFQDPAEGALYQAFHEVKIQAGAAIERGQWLEGRWL